MVFYYFTEPLAHMTLALGATEKRSYLGGGGVCRGLLRRRVAPIGRQDNVMYVNIVK